MSLPVYGRSNWRRLLPLWHDKIFRYGLTVGVLVGMVLGVVAGPCLRGQSAQERLARLQLQAVEQVMPQFLEGQRMQREFAASYQRMQQQRQAGK